MRKSDIEQLLREGLITSLQHDIIIHRHRLDRESNRLLVILGVLGAILLVSGAVLLVAANWDSVPKAPKIVGGILLMLAAHLFGWRLGRGGENPAVSTTFHLVGAGLFLANIALVGQIYHLGSRAPNAVLLWLVGIAPLPWILRSRALHILTLATFGVWLGLELAHEDGLLRFGGESRMCSFYLLLGVLFVGLGGWLRRGPFGEFAGATEKFGLLGVHNASLPLMIGAFYGQSAVTQGAWILSGAVAALGLALVATALARNVDGIPRKWRWVWFGTLLVVVAVGLTGLLAGSDSSSFHRRGDIGPHWLVIPVLFGVSLVQVQVGLQRASAFHVNLAIVAIAVQVLVAYLQLFGSMADTGMIFVSTGLLLILLGWYLERQRRSLVRNMRSAA
jgi:uncharacterized membrane protein